jgi:hypothetical protein
MKLKRSLILTGMVKFECRFDLAQNRHLFNGKEGWGGALTRELEDDRVSSQLYLVFSQTRPSQPSAICRTVQRPTDVFCLLSAIRARNY